MRLKEVHITTGFSRWAKAMPLQTVVVLRKINGPFDMTFLEIGAYDKNWDKIHLGPELAVRAHIDLRGKVLLPIHWGAYDLSIHPWKEPVERVIKAAEKSNIMFSLPKPGQLLSENKLIMNSRWWEA